MDANYRKEATMPAEGVGTVIIHEGTNNLSDPNQLPGSIAMQLEELALSIQERENNCAVIVSSTTVRNDNDYDAKSSLTNSEICKVCQTNKWLFVDNSNIDDTSLNRSGLHLNSKSDSLLASNIVRVLRGNSDRPTNPGMIEETIDLQRKTGRVFGAAKWRPCGTFWSCYRIWGEWWSNFSIWCQRYQSNPPLKNTQN